MPRRPRLEIAGFYHVINRGVAKGKIYNSDDDKDKFLEILCKACREYNVNLHTYCLMNNHYHLLIETTRSNNLSLFMRQINSNYAIYFNKKYNRVGHLWQGRYKSWYVIDSNYLYTLYRYIEHNPIEAKIASVVGEYKYTLLSTVIRDDLKVIPCAKNSQILKEINYKGIREHLELELSEEELEKIKKFQKTKIILKDKKYIKEKSKILNEYFSDIKNKDERNRAIIKAISDGYKQIEIANYLNLSPSAIAKIRSKYE